MEDVGASSATAVTAHAPTVSALGRSAEPDPDPRAAAAAVTAGIRLGRYVVLEEVGHGGMGRVLRAYDPKLQREVALKELLPPFVDHNGRTRLVREARAMAKLNHPNVVAVHDVEELDDERVLLVMEYVRGTTLAGWLQSKPAWREIVDRLVAAGRGLVAAHGAGLLHRDFKPANVLVGEDGSVKVTDFGLAVGRYPQSETDASTAASGSETTDGVVKGTPRYMAPEQHRAESLGPAADQYALCVALWEALCGAPPFRGIGIEQRKEAGPPPWPESKIPGPVAAAIRRGLAPQTGDRWPNVAALLDALTRGMAGRRRRVRGLVALTSAAAVASFGYAWASERARPCTGADDEIAVAWSPSQRDAVHDAILAIDAPYAVDVADHTLAAMDAYAAAWVEQHTDACAATSVRGEQSQTVLDQRMACLQRARGELRAVADALAEADADAVQRAHTLTEGLPPLARCADLTALAAAVEPPTEEDAETVAWIRERVADARARRGAGHYAAARAAIEEADARLAEVDYLPIQAEVALVRGLVLVSNGDYEGAQAALAEAIHLASRGRKWALLRDAALEQLTTLGGQLQRPKEARHYAELALGLAEGDPLEEARVHHGLAIIADAAGEYATAEAEHREALARREEALGADARAVGSSRNSLAGVLHALGKQEEAEAQYRRALAIYEGVLGPEHPVAAAVRANLAGVLGSRGALAEAEAEHRRALALRIRSLGADHPEVGASRHGLGNALAHQGKFGEAEAEYREALAVLTASVGPVHPHVAGALSQLGEILEAQGRYAEAEAEHRRALAVAVEALGPDHPKVPVARVNLAGTLLLQGKLQEAEAEYRAAVKAWEAAFGPEHPATAKARVDLAMALLQRGELQAAEVEARRGVAVTEAAVGADHRDTASARALLARVLDGLGRAAEAEVEGRRALEIEVAALGADHPSVAASRANLADILRKRGKTHDARAEAERALSTFETALGAGHPHTVATRINLAGLLFDEQEREAAVGVAKDLWGGRSAADFGPEIRGEGLFVEARVLAASRDPAAHARAKEALALIEGLRPPHADRVAAVQTWLRAHR